MSEHNTEEMFESQDIEKNRKMSAFAYIAFFLPLFFCPDSNYAKFHANQGLLLLIVNVVGSFIFQLLKFIPVVGGLFHLAIAGLTIYGFVNAFKGRAVRLPILGRYDILT